MHGLYLCLGNLGGSEGLRGRWVITFYLRAYIAAVSVWFKGAGGCWAVMLDCRAYFASV